MSHVPSTVSMNLTNTSTTSISCTCAVCFSMFSKVQEIHSYSPYVYGGTGTGFTGQQITYIPPDNNNMICDQCLNLLRSVLQRERTGDYGW